MSIRRLFFTLFGALILLLGGVFLVMTRVVANQAEFAAAENRRYESYKLADELRQSSDDLTRMARTYVVTGDPAFARYFDRILAIRAGDEPRPEGYGGVYWDFVTSTGREGEPNGEAVPLIELMERMGFTDDELELLREAERRSNALAELEVRAMTAVREAGAASIGPDGQPSDLEAARMLVYGEAYHTAKARIMEPIETFFERVEARTAAEVQSLREAGDRLLKTAIALMIVAVALLLLGYWLIRARITAPVDRLAAHAREVEQGVYDGRVPTCGQDELAQLGRTFNQMAEAIERDITQRERDADALAEARNQAETANQAKSAFLATMSHELRTPMNAIIGYSEMLMEELEDEGKDDYVADLRKVNHAGRHLLALINDILDLSKVEAGKVELFLETFRVDDLVDGVVSTVQPLIEQNGNTLVVERDEGLGEMHADLTKVRQVLLNLISNATKFTNKGAVTLTATRNVEADTLRFEIADSGIGIPADRLDSIFEAFTQADSSTTREYGGTGLGLPISRRFCQLMGGDVTVTSEPGKGSTFTVTLPARVPEEEPAEEDALDQTEGEGPLVLVIDDDPVARDVISRIIRRDGFRVATAPGAEEGLRLARELRPMAITLDIIMPGTDGWGVLTALKAEPGIQDIPVIMVSILEENRMAQALGASEYVTKPVDRKRLCRLLGRYSRQEGSNTVLIVEDEADIREMLRRLVEKQGWVAMEASDGREGLERVKETRPDLILTDLMMPAMDGFEFVERLRQVETWRDIPVIVLTAKDLTAEDRQRLNGNVERVLDKGSQDPDQLLARLRELIEPSEAA